MKKAGNFKPLSVVRKKYLFGCNGVGLLGGWNSTIEISAPMVKCVRLIRSFVWFVRSFVWFVRSFVSFSNFFCNEAEEARVEINCCGWWCDDGQNVVSIRNEMNDCLMKGWDGMEWSGMKQQIDVTIGCEWTWIILMAHVSLVPC